jgi:SAM-dependent methyltransferase
MCLPPHVNTQVSSSDVVLELGCSYGMATNMLAEHAAAVIGIDNSQEAVAEVRHKVFEGWKHCQGQQGNSGDGLSCICWRLVVEMCLQAAAAPGHVQGAIALITVFIYYLALRLYR